MSGKNILVVFGATGNQGGAVIKSILDDPEAAAKFSLRGITRDTSSEKAKALAAKGVELVQADLNSKESLKAAFKGAHSVFAVTNYWEKQDEKLERQQGINVADAAKEDGIQHLLWSSLSDVNEMTSGRLPNVYHFDAKASVETYIVKSGIPATFIHCGFYMLNIPGGMFREDNGAWKFQLPIPGTSPIPLFDSAADTGKFVKAALLNREELLGKRLYASAEFVTCDQIVDTFKKVYPEAGKTAEYQQISNEQFKGGMGYAGYNEKAQLEMLENILLFNDVGYYGKDGEELLKESLKFVKEKPTTWEDFVRKAPAWKDLK